jgi:hypothetical protein
MKKGLRWFLIAAVVITAILYGMRGTTILKDKAGNPYIETITQTNDLNLGDFLDQYNSGAYTKIKLVNDDFLQGYRPVSGDEVVSSMALQKKVKVQSYVIDKAQKPHTTSLKDIGISLTGGVEVTVVTEEE